MSIAYYGGKFMPEEEVRLPLSERCIFFGDGIYDAAIGCDGYIYLEEEHTDRFFGNAKRLDLPLSMKKDELSSILHKLIELSGLDSYFIYFQLTRSAYPRSHAYPDTQSSSLLITIKQHSLPSPDTELRLITEKDIRHSLCDVKTLNLLPAVLASRRAQSLGCDEAVFLRDKSVTECAHSNIFIVKDGILVTHPKDENILPGVTRNRIIELSSALGIKTEERKFSKDELFSADGVLISSTTKLCLSAKEIDGIAIKCQKSSVGDRIIKAIREDFWQKKLNNF
jgi:D-alanine transaminase